MLFNLFLVCRFTRESPFTFRFPIGPPFLLRADTLSVVVLGARVVARSRMLFTRLQILEALPRSLSLARTHALAVTCKSKLEYEIVVHVKQEVDELQL